MKLNLDRPAAIQLVRGYGPEGILLGDRWYRSNLILTTATVIEDWPPRDVESITGADLEPLIALRPEVLLLGSGPRQRFPSPAVLTSLHEARIGFEVMDTGAACRTYNLLAVEGRDVAAALIIEPG